MLETLLAMLRRGGTRRVEDLARELGTTPELVEMMVEDLVRMGVLRPMSVSCAERCAGCLAAGVCTVGGRGRAWVLSQE